MVRNTEKKAQCQLRRVFTGRVGTCSPSSLISESCQGLVDEIHSLVRRVFPSCKGPAIRSESTKDSIEDALVLLSQIAICMTFKQSMKHRRIESDLDCPDLPCARAARISLAKTRSPKIFSWHNHTRGASTVYLRSSAALGTTLNCVDQNAQARATRSLITMQRHPARDQLAAPRGLWANGWVGS